MSLKLTKGGGTYFHWGGGGGGQRQIGHYNVKKGTNGAHADNITNMLMKHHCRHKVSFYMLSVVFFSWGELNKNHITKRKKNKGPACKLMGLWMLSDTILVLF